MKPVCERIPIVVTVFLVVVLSGGETNAQDNPLGLQNAWTLAGQGPWNDVNNWQSMSLPDRSLAEYASIYNGGTAVISSAIAASALDIYLGHQDVEEAGPFGPGSLIIEDGGGIAALGDAFAGNGQLRNGAGDVGTLTLHDAMGTVSLEGYLQSGASTLRLEIGGTTFNPVTVSREIELDGTLELTGALASANASSTWTIFDGSAGGASVSGQFQQIVDNTGYTLGPGQSFAVSTANNSVTLGFQQHLLLLVDPYAGTAVLSNPAGSGVDIDLAGYMMSVSNGTVNESQWVTFSDDGIGGFDQGSSENELIEMNLTGVATITSGNSKDFGAPLAININQPVGTRLVDSVSLQYVTSDNEILDAVIIHDGNRQNDLVLAVDPDTGNTVLQNQSNVDLDLTAYLIESDSGALLGTWDSLEEQQIPGWDVVASTANTLMELNLEDSSLLGVGDSLDLGVLWDRSAEDLTLQYLVAGSLDVTNGAVFYGDPADIGAGVDGDYDGDGDVDGNDFMLWQRGESPNPVSPGDLTLWLANFGNPGGPSMVTSAVPEPSGLCLVVVSLLAAAALRRKTM